VRSLNVLINFARALAKARKLDDPASSRRELARPYGLNFANENYERRTGADSEPIPSSLPPLNPPSASGEQRDFNSRLDDLSVYNKKLFREIDLISSDKIARILHSAYPNVLNSELICRDVDANFILCITIMSSLSIRNINFLGFLKI